MQLISRSRNPRKKRRPPPPYLSAGWRKAPPPPPPPPREQQLLQRVRSRGQLVALDRAGRIDAFRTSRRTFAHQGARPSAVGRGQDIPAIRRTLVARVQVVPLPQRDRRRTEEVGVQRVHRARRVAQHAVDTHAELLECIEFGRGLPVFAVFDGRFIMPDEPRLHTGQLGHEVTDVDNEIADHREVSHRLHPHRPG